jgi:ERCC4-type nuclease
VVRKLDTGDYSAQLGNLSFERDICIERKRNLDEICGNFTAERERFEREFLRAKAYGTKVHLIIENATWSDIFLGNYRSKLSPKSLVGSLLSWMVRFNISVIFCKPEETARVMWGIFYYYAKERLMYG